MEAKRKQQEEAAAAELSQWVEQFEGDDDKPKQQFVRGGIMGRPQREDGPRGGQRRGSTTSMFGGADEADIDGEDIDGESIDGAPLSSAAAGRTGTGGARLAAPVLRKKEIAAPAALGAGARKREQRPSQMASFMEELRREHEERESRGERDSIEAKKEVSSTSFDNQDPETTNLYVGNLNPAISEEILFNQFARFGPIQSVKIMWPRTEEEHACVARALNRPRPSRAPAPFSCVAPPLPKLSVARTHLAGTHLLPGASFAPHPRRPSLPLSQAWPALWIRRLCQP